MRLSRTCSVTNQLIEARCSIDVPNVHGMTALHAAERMGHTAISTLVPTHTHSLTHVPTHTRSRYITPPPLTREFGLVH
jgi:hypothetical protein